MSLATQLRGLYIIGALAFLFRQPFSWLNFPAFVWWAALGWFSKFSHLDPKPGEEICRNIMKVDIFFILLRSAIYWIVPTSLLIGEYVTILLAGIFVTMSCEPKPPRPKHLTRLVSVTEGV